MANQSTNGTTKIHDLYHQPLGELLYRAQQTHRKHFTPGTVQLAKLISIKTGGCPEDCAYCPQSVHHNTDVKSEALLPINVVVNQARIAKQSGATRFCMGAAWREVRDGRSFDKVLEMVKQVAALGMETCCTLGMLTAEQAERLREAGLYAYNHNIDTSRRFYRKIISTRTYESRLETIQHIRAAKITVCCGVILGMGENTEDHVEMLSTLSSLDPQPESVPVNALVPVPGTKLEHQPPFEPLVLVRFIATARILMPKSMIRLSAGRTRLSESDHLLCFLAGANSIFAGDKLLTTANPGYESDERLFKNLDVQAMTT